MGRSGCFVESQCLAVANFIRENVIYRFGIPKRLSSDNGTPFVNFETRHLCEEYGIDHIKSTPYYPQGNGQAEATNKTLLRILSRMVYEEPKRWSDHLPLVLWAYRTSKRTSTQATPFSLIYGTEAVVPVEIDVLSARLALASKVLDPERRAYDVEVLEERRQKAEKKRQTYQDQISRAYNKRVKPRTLRVGDLVLKAAGHVQKGLKCFQICS